MSLGTAPGLYKEPASRLNVLVRPWSSLGIRAQSGLPEIVFSQVRFQAFLEHGGELIMILKGHRA
jgi:hypothetical protein